MVVGALLCVGLVAVLFVVTTAGGDEDTGGLEFVVEVEEKQGKGEILFPVDEEGFQEVQAGLLPFTAAEVAYLDISPKSRLTVEYSFKVDPDLFEEDREDGLDFYLGLLERHMFITGVDRSSALVSTRCESAYRGINAACKPTDGHVLVRVRNYIDGYRANTQTVDLKESFLGYPTAAEAAQTRLLVSPEFEGEEKLERDQHVCNAKYSREGRVLGFEYNRALHKCKEVTKLFPGLSMKYPEAAMPTLSEGWLWWVWQVNGVVPMKRPDGSIAEMDYQLTLTLQYAGGCDQLARSVNARVHKRPSVKSEFSVRFFATNQGHGPWDAAVQTVDESYQALSLVLHELGLVAAQDLQCD